MSPGLRRLSAMPEESCQKQRNSYAGSSWLVAGGFVTWRRDRAEGGNHIGGNRPGLVKNILKMTPVISGSRGVSLEFTLE